MSELQKDLNRQLEKKMRNACSDMKTLYEVAGIPLSLFMADAVSELLDLATTILAVSRVPSDEAARMFGKLLDEKREGLPERWSRARGKE